jgi:hypothetical protein
MDTSLFQAQRKISDCSRIAQMFADMQHFQRRIADCFSPLFVLSSKKAGRSSFAPLYVSY